jgi:hypothetical protein
VVLLTRRSFSLSDFFCCLRSLPSSSAQCCPASRVFIRVAIFLGPVLCPLVDCLGTEFLPLKPIWLPCSLSSMRRPELSFSSHRGVRLGRHPGSVFHRFFPSAVGPSSPLSTHLDPVLFSLPPACWTPVPAESAVFIAVLVSALRLGHVRPYSWFCSASEALRSSPASGHSLDLISSAHPSFSVLRVSTVLFHSTIGFLAQQLCDGSCR